MSRNKIADEKRMSVKTLWTDGASSFRNSKGVSATRCRSVADDVISFYNCVELRVLRLARLLALAGGGCWTVCSLLSQTTTITSRREIITQLSAARVLSMYIYLLAISRHSCEV